MTESEAKPAACMHAVRQYRVKQADNAQYYAAYHSTVCHMIHLIFVSKMRPAELLFCAASLFFVYE